MTDSSAAAIAREADAAANEAARDARAEVMERAAADPQPAEKPSRRDRKLAEESKAKDGWLKFVADIWITNLNSVEFGVYKHARNRAKSRLAFAKSCRHCALAGSFRLSSVIIATICSKRRIASGKSPRCSANKPSLA